MHHNKVDTIQVQTLTQCTFAHNIKLLQMLTSTEEISLHMGKYRMTVNVDDGGGLLTYYYYYYYYYYYTPSGSIFSGIVESESRVFSSSGRARITGVGRAS